MAIDNCAISSTGRPRALTVAEVLPTQPDVSQPIYPAEIPGKMAVYYNDALGICTLYILDRTGRRWLRLNSPP